MTLQESYERQLLGRMIADRSCYMENTDTIMQDLFCIYQDNQAQSINPRL